MRKFLDKLAEHTSRPTSWSGLVISAEGNFRSAVTSWRQCILFAACLFLPWNACLAEDSQDREQQIKTAYLYHFSKFTEWPEAGPVFHYCVYGDSNFAALLEQSYRNKTIGSADIEVININRQSKVDNCELIYFAQTVSADYLDKISKLSILTISEQADFSALGGIIYLFEENEKLRFYVNNKNATNAGLKISSQLLKLSKEP